MVVEADPPRFRLADFRTGVRERYAPLAENPSSRFHYHAGRELAERLGYTQAELDAVPPEALARFCGMGRPLSLGSIEPGSTVLDVGCGSGTDAFVAARTTGPSGCVVGIDAVGEMVAVGSEAEGADAVNVEFIEGYAEELPFAGRSFDVVVTNGLLHLCPDKQRVLTEALRVLRPGGRLLGADVFIERFPPRSTRDLIFRWTKCVVGALTPDDARSTFANAGFENVRFGRPIDVFDGARGEVNADHYGALGFAFSAAAPRTG